MPSEPFAEEVLRLLRYRFPCVDDKLTCAVKQPVRNGRERDRNEMGLGDRDFEPKLFGKDPIQALCQLVSCPL